MKSFHNTIDAKGQALIDFEAGARSQEDIVLEVFNSVRKPMTWSEVSGFLPDMNEVSLKRAITNLFKRGQLAKTDQQVLGKWGKPCYKYQLK